MTIDTIFAPSFGNRPSQLVGREPQIGTMLAGLDSAPGSRERSIVMLGQRGSGKTVLLWELAERARARGWTVASPTILRGDARQDRRETAGRRRQVRRG